MYNVGYMKAKIAIEIATYKHPNGKLVERTLKVPADINSKDLQRRVGNWGRGRGVVVVRSKVTE